MSGDLQGGRRLAEAIRLRDAALAVLQREGKQSHGRHGDVEFQPATPENPYPRLSLLLTKHALDGHPILNVWAPWKDKYGKVLNIKWLGHRVELISFRRGEWETELLAMGGSAGAARRS